MKEGEREFSFFFFGRGGKGKRSRIAKRTFSVPEMAMRIRVSIYFVAFQVGKSRFFAEYFSSKSFERIEEIALCRMGWIPDDGVWFRDWKRVKSSLNRS